MTFSIAARCPETGMFGVAISSSSPAVAARCAWVRAGVGAACTQNITDPRLGPALLDRLARGDTASQAIAAITAAEPLIAWRQLTVIGPATPATPAAAAAAGAPGQPAAASQPDPGAAYSGDGVLGLHASALGEHCVAAGNLLATPDVPQAMTAAFAAAATAGRPFGDRLVAAMQAAVAAGGEAGPVHSAGMLIVREVPWPVADLRVDWSDDPIAGLAHLWDLWAPQLDAYVTRALNPSGAPSYGVPGDR
ncbi:MAG: DUF1028 domain-containing protein [Chloroflexota bacterium]